MSKSINRLGAIGFATVTTRASHGAAMRLHHSASVNYRKQGELT